MKKLLILFICAVCMFTSCVPYISDTWESDKVSSYNYLCKQLEDHYVYFDYKGLDFQNIKTTYASQINNSMSDEDYFEVLQNFIRELKDGHANIYTPFTSSTVGDSFIEGYADNYDVDVINNNYLNTEAIYGINLKNSIIERNGNFYGYIYYSSFMNTFSMYEIEYILNRFRKANVKGIILDIRNNGGGSLSNATTLVSYFGGAEPGTTTTVLKGWRRDSKDVYTQINELDHTFLISSSFNVTANDKVYQGPVALLTNRLSFSASSFTATSFKAFNNVKQIGGDTGGGMGLPIGGTLPNGWTYRFSGNIVMDYRATSYTQDKYNYENGVPADSEINDDPDIDTNDEIIDAAISWISDNATIYVD